MYDVIAEWLSSKSILHDAGVWHTLHFYYIPSRRNIRVIPKSKMFSHLHFNDDVVILYSDPELFDKLLKMMLKCERT